VGYGRPQSAGDLNDDGFNDLVIADLWNDDAAGTAGAAAGGNPQSTTSRSRTIRVVSSDVW
jgi:hypothetical protein